VCAAAAPGYRDFHLDESFSNPVAVGGVSPWHIIQRYGFSVPISPGANLVCRF
jgi:hypothetical protein